MRQLLKEHKGKAIISSAIVLLPMLIGLLLWNALPPDLTTHWGADGAADGTGSKAFAVFGLPALLLAAHWLCLLVVLRDQEKRGQTRAAVSLCFWLLPMISLLCCGVVFAAALEREIDMAAMVRALLAVMFIVIGNFMPKVKRNGTLGVKVKWALENEENWNRTHRFAGWLWVLGGFALLLSQLLSEKAGVNVMIGLVIVLALLPILYSYLYYRAQRRAGSYTVENSAAPGKAATRAGTVIAAVVLIGAAVLMSTGDIGVRMDAESFTVEASYFADLTVRYGEIDSIELRDRDDPGTRVGGFGTPRLSMGSFRNDEFGRYTRYTYTGADACIVLRGSGGVLVLGAKTDAHTQLLYEALRGKIAS